MGHRSLDYRIRDSESMREAILKMVMDLTRSLDEVLDYLNGKEEQEDEEFDTDSDTESDMDLLLDSVKDPIDRLYKMAVWIRDPATRIPSSKARNFQRIDEETKVDLFKAFEPLDYDYISSLFLQYEKDKALQETQAAKGEAEVGDLDTQDQVWEPVRTTLKLSKLRIETGTESYLVRRIAQANGRRRQQFAYWRSHKGKLRAHSSVVVDAPTHELPSGGHQMEAGNQNTSIKAPLTVATATQLTSLSGEAKEVFEKANFLDYAVSEYAPSAWEPSKDIVSFPLPPRVAATEQFFECPYCFTICPVSILSEKAWRAHLIRDLRPYVCTFEHCPISDQLYDSRDDWIQHEVSAHQTMFQCPVHPDDTLNSPEAYERHIQSHCQGEMLPLSLAKSTMTDIQRSCPVCSIDLQNTQESQSHIALHLERFAMFTLPRSTDDPDGGDLRSQSTGAHLASDRSLNGFSETGSVVSFTAENSDIITKRSPGDFDVTREQMLERLMSVSQELENIFTRPVSMLHLFPADMALVQSQIKALNGDMVRFFEMGDALGHSFLSIVSKTFVVEVGEICVKAGLLEEAINTFESLKSVQASQLPRSDPALLRAQQQLELVYEVKKTLQDVQEALGPEADLQTEPGKSLALEKLARTALGMHHAETIWGPSIREEMTKVMADDGTAAHKTVLEGKKRGADSGEHNSGGSQERTGSEAEILESEKPRRRSALDRSSGLRRTLRSRALSAQDQQGRNSLAEQDRRPTMPQESNEDEERLATVTPRQKFKQLHTNDGSTASDTMSSGTARLEATREGEVEASQPQTAQEHDEDDTQMADPENDLAREPRQIRMVERENERKRALSASPPRRPRRPRRVANRRREAFGGSSSRDLGLQRPNRWRCVTHRPQCDEEHQFAFESCRQRTRIQVYIKLPCI
ncbi:uncharacterized protein TRIREDRAFT_106625 [Trichoderma reesei QM6a]|uniref:Predicted protein n=2 Tax=Hypocrea jecorina TaxID=51453 RepID=G0RGX2_HYPJQ|nr:uncharacterized protein TRIREDRAFT_106625 [Trichoderma reesei QM6a]EGR49435.1 predicted protein [Trichoderma reesei QM6a]ETS02789.1 hypothetical protein M419DRAFT_128956 [Trichoderma reesei RUT C-30]